MKEAAVRPTLELRAEKPVHGGTVLARQGEGEGGRVVFVHDALPGELVRTESLGRRGGAAFARAVEVLEASNDRVPAPCPHFGVCGGCQWQHASYPAQLRIKREVVEEVWARAGLRLPPDTPILGMEDPWRYRLRGEFEAAYRQGADGERALVLGFHRMRSHAVIPIQTCPIHHERIERGLLAFGDAARELGVRGLVNLHLTAEPGGPGLLWRVRYQRGDDGAQTPALIAAVAERLPDVVLLDDSMRYDVGDLQFRVRSDTFIQTNHRQTPVLYGAAMQMLAARPDEHVLDLFCGIGTMTLTAARRAASVVGVEENPRAIRLAQLAARINETPNVRFHAGRVEEVLPRIKVGSCEAAIVDPPRAGLERSAIGELLRLQPRRLVYVSCEPSTHVRDIGLFLNGGYRVRRAALVDMFPHTYHVESVALLERA